MSSTAAFAQAPRESKASRAAPAPEAPKPQHVDIDRNGVLILVKSAMLALDQANKTGNYTVLRDLGSRSFQANTAARLTEIFAALRNQRVDLSGVLVLDPQLTLLPQIEPNGALHMRGFFPSTPKQVNFDIQWEPEERQWRLFSLGINIVDGGPAAPESPAAPPPRASEKAPPPSAPTGAVLPPPPARQ